MPLSEIYTFDAPVLRKRAKRVRRVNNKVRKELDEMLCTMRKAPGIGLAAPQVGLLKRMVVIDIGEGPYFLINPEFVSQSSETEVKWEGCLSWPGYIGEVERPLRVCVKALDRNGSEIWLEGEGLLARVICHEIDHLDGVLFVDRASSIVEVEQDDALDCGGLSSLSCIFMGSPDFAVPVLNEIVGSGMTVSLVVSQPDRPFGRKRRLTPTPVKARALELGLDVFTPENLNTSEAVSKLESVQPDFIVVAAYGQRLPGKVLKIPRYECLNVHPSLLPKYRGGNPVQRQIMAGEQKSGISIIYMGDRMDAGDICLQKSIDIKPDETYGELEGRLSTLGAHSLVEAMALVLSGDAPRKPQNHEVSSLAPHLKPGEEIVDWRASPAKIHDHVRALSPVPGAVTVFGTERLKIWRTQILPSEGTAPPDEVPGTLIRIDGTMAVVKCGRGLEVIGVMDVQPAGRTIMTADAFAAGRQQRIIRFG